MTHGQCGPSIITIVIITPLPPPLSSSSCVNKRRRQGRGEHPTPPAGIGKSYQLVFPNGFFNGLATFFPIGFFLGVAAQPVAYAGIFDRGCVSSLSRPSFLRTQRRHGPTYYCVFKEQVFNKK